MPKHSSNDINEAALTVIPTATGQIAPPPKPAKNPAAVALGRLGGLKGGNARAAKLSADARKQIATKAAASRWAKVRGQ